MRKATVTIFAVAIIGALGVYSKGHSVSNSAANPTTDSQPTATLPTSQSTVQSDSTTNPGVSSGNFQDGNYTGATEDTPYGPVQIAVIVSGGQITNINFLQMPSEEGHSREVTAFSEPLLKQETLQKQSAHIDFVTGATDTSAAYQHSLQAALNQAA